MLMSFFWQAHHRFPKIHVRNFICYLAPHVPINLALIVRTHVQSHKQKTVRFLRARSADLCKKCVTLDLDQRIESRYTFCIPGCVLINPASTVVQVEQVKPVFLQRALAITRTADDEVIQFPALAMKSKL